MVEPHWCQTDTRVEQFYNIFSTRLNMGDCTTARGLFSQSLGSLSRVYRQTLLAAGRAPAGLEHEGESEQLAGLGASSRIGDLPKVSQRNAVLLKVLLLQEFVLRQVRCARQTCQCLRDSLSSVRVDECTRAKALTTSTFQCVYLVRVWY